MVGMRITVSHTQTQEQAVKAVDRTFDDFFKGVSVLPLEILNEQRKWVGQTLHFSFSAKIGLLSSPVKGTVDVTSKDLTIDVDFGLLEKLLGSGVGRKALENRVRGLLS